MLTPLSLALVNSLQPENRRCLLEIKGSLNTAQWNALLCAAAGKGVVYQMIRYPLYLTTSSTLPRDAESVTSETKWAHQQAAILHLQDSR